MTDTEAKKIIERYWELVTKAKQKLAGTIIPQDKCNRTGGYKIKSLADLFICKDGSICATVHPYAPDDEFYVSVPTNAFEEL